MKTIFIGSSNVSRYIDSTSEETKNSVTVQKCTRIEQFKVYLNVLEEGDEKVIVSVIENFLCDRAKGKVTKGDIEQAVGETLETFTELVKEAATRLPQTKFVFVEPMARVAVPWYTAGLGDITNEYGKKLRDLLLLNIYIIKRCDLPAQIFVDDGVHLTQESGQQFVEAVVYYAEDNFKADVVDLDNGQEESAMEVVASGSGFIGLSQTEPPRKKTLEEELQLVQKRMEDRWQNDSIVFARIREELDFQANAKKEDRVVITGLVSAIAKPRGEADQKNWINDAVAVALNGIVEGSGNKVQFVNSGRTYGDEFPVCEVKMKEKALAIKIRRDFGQQKREGRIEGRMFVANSVTLATRVRLEVLRAIAKVCSNPNEDFFVMGFTPRPVLQIKRKTGGGQLVLTYVDAVVKYGGRVGESDLRLAYERAGLTFRGQMQQNFIILTEEGVREGGRQATGGAAGRPQQARSFPQRSGASGTLKRSRDGEGANQNTAKKQTGFQGKGNRNNAVEAKGKKD